MTFSTSKFNKKLAIAALVASAFGATAFTQNATPGTPPEGRGGMQHQMGKMGAGEQGKGQGAGQGQGPGFMHERMQAHRQARAEKRLAELVSDIIYKNPVFLQSENENAYQYSVYAELLGID